jgi:hypothetical protein
LRPAHPPRERKLDYKRLFGLEPQQNSVSRLGIILIQKVEVRVTVRTRINDGREVS